MHPERLTYWRGFGTETRPPATGRWRCSVDKETEAQKRQVQIPVRGSHDQIDTKAVSDLHSHSFANF
jgi:hypothetical protein